MLEKIKSTFILKKIFIFTNEKVKLKSVIYNKRIQKKLGLTIIDYRRKSGKYLETNEYGYTTEFNSYNHKKILKEII